MKFRKITGFFFCIYCIFFSCVQVEEEIIDVYYNTNTEDLDTLYYTAYNCAINITGHDDSDSMIITAQVRADKNENNNNVRFDIIDKHANTGELKLFPEYRNVGELPMEKCVSLHCRNTLNLNLTLVGSLSISGMNSFQTITSIQFVKVYENFDYYIETTKGCSLFVFGEELTLYEFPKRVDVKLIKPEPDFKGIWICPANTKYRQRFCASLPACSAFVEIPKGFPASITANTYPGNVIVNGKTVGKKFDSCINGADKDQNPIVINAAFYAEIIERD